MPEGKGKASKEPRTQGQGQPQQREGQPQQGQRDTQPPRQGQRDNQKGGEGGKAAAKSGNNVKLTVEQRTTIRQTVLQGSNAPRVSNVNFNVRVGTVVPRTVTLVAVPAPLIEIYPAWRSYVYFIVGEQIIIVEPSSHKIVAVLVV